MRVGYSADYTRIGIYVDGVRIGGDESTSGNSGLNWQNRQFAFTGNGSRQTIRIVSEATRRDANGRGMMIDDIALTERLPLNTVLEDTAIRLSAISAALVDVDGSERLAIHVGGLPVGAVLSDGVRNVTMAANQSLVDITGWNLTALVLTPPHNFNGLLNLQVTATATEQSSGAQAATTRLLAVNVLPVNDAPQALNARYQVQRNGSIRIDLTDLVGDVDGDRLMLTFTGMPEKGSLTRNTDGSFTYTPRRNVTGTDIIGFQVTDGLISTQAVITLQIGKFNEDGHEDVCHYPGAGATLQLYAAPGTSKEICHTTILNVSAGNCVVNWDGRWQDTGLTVGNHLLLEEDERVSELWAATGLIVRR